MTRLTRQEFENFFAFFKNEPHQKEAVGKLYAQLGDALLSADADWVKTYRTPAKVAPTATFTMPLRRSADLIEGRFEIRRGPVRLLSVRATSGINPYQNHGDWNLKGKGPIPPFEGITVRTKPVWLPQTGIEGNFYPIDPFTFSNGRGDFGVHFDANVPGSAGCIVILERSEWNKTQQVFEALLKEGTLSIPLSVSYGGKEPAATPRPSAKETMAEAIAKLKTTGASARTAAQDGISAGGPDASARLARTDLERVRRKWNVISKVAADFGFPPALIAAIASRESRVGNALADGWGDGGNGYGDMQVDRRYHAPAQADGPSGYAHYRQATGILNSYFDSISRKFPDWSLGDRIRGALVAYNSGVSNVQTIERIDVGTTGNDYSADVIARAQYYLTVLG